MCRLSDVFTRVYCDKTAEAMIARFHWKLARRMSLDGSFDKEIQISPSRSQNRATWLYTASVQSRCTVVYDIYLVYKCYYPDLGQFKIIHNRSINRAYISELHLLGSWHKIYFFHKSWKLIPLCFGGQKYFGFLPKIGKHVSWTLPWWPVWWDQLQPVERSYYFVSW